MSDEQDRGRRFAWQGILVLALPFVLLLLAYVLRTGGDYRGEPGAIQLIEAPVMLEGIRPPGTARLWRMVWPVESGCDAACSGHLGGLHHYRVALGRRSLLVEIVVLSEGTLSDGQRKILLEAAPSVRFARASQQQWQLLRSAAGSETGLLVNPQDYVVARLPADADTGAVMKDLRRLIR